MKLGKSKNADPTDTERMDALQRWLDSADLETGHVDFRIPGFLSGYVRISANVRQTVDAAIIYERRNAEYDFGVKQ